MEGTPSGRAPDGRSGLKGPVGTAVRRAPVTPRCSSRLCGVEQAPAASADHRAGESECGPVAAPSLLRTCLCESSGS